MQVHEKQEAGNRQTNDEAAENGSSEKSCLLMQFLPLFLLLFGSAAGEHVLLNRRTRRKRGAKDGVDSRV